MAKRLEKTDEPFVYRPTTLDTAEPEDSPPAHWHLFWASGACNSKINPIGRAGKTGLPNPDFVTI